MVDETSHPELKKITEHYQSDELFECVHVSKDETDTLDNIQGSAILIFRVSDRDSLTRSLKVLKDHFKQTRTGLIKTACFLDLENKKVEKAISKLGCREFLNHDINERSLKFKIDFWSKSLINQIKQIQQTEMTVKNSQKTSSEKVRASGFDFKNIPALDINEDIWLNSRGNLCKRVLRSIMIRLVGPCQGAVYWKENRRLDSGDQLYSLVFATNKVRSDVYENQETIGEWFYEGSKPEFDWDNGEWIFTGQSPKLYFKKENQKIVRFNFDETGQFIANTSMLANRKLGVYFELKKNAHQFEHSPETNQLKKEEEVDGNSPENLRDLEGTGSTEHINNGNLQGNSSTDDLGSSHMEGSSSTDDLGSGNMQGEASTDDLGGNLQGQASTDDLGGNLQGKASTDDLGGNLQGKASTDDLGGNLQGKASTDDLGNHLEGKNSTDNLDEDLEGKAQTEKKENQLKGKGSTDQIYRSQYQDKESTAETEEQAEEDDNLTDVIFSQMQKKKTTRNNFEEMTEAPYVHISLSYQVENLVKTVEGTLVEWNEEEFCVMAYQFDVEEIDNITVFIDVKYNSQSYKFKMLGKIEGFTPNTNGDATYYLKFDKDYEVERNQFIDIYAQRQSHINTFMKLAKGQ